MELPGPIIVIDDDHEDHELLLDVCQRIGVEDSLMFFDNGIQFIDHLRADTERPFLILCDINMPLINGLDVRKIIDEDPSLRKKTIPFIFLSTSASDSQIKRAYDMTVQGFFLKGQTFNETEKRLRLILDYWLDCKHPSK
jgi:CheY-like chemotaxis protein